MELPVVSFERNQSPTPCTTASLTASTRMRPESDSGSLEKPVPKTTAGGVTLAAGLNSVHRMLLRTIRLNGAKSNAIKGFDHRSTAAQSRGTLTRLAAASTCCGRIVAPSLRSRFFASATHVMMPSSKPTLPIVSVIRTSARSGI